MFGNYNEVFGNIPVENALRRIHEENLNVIRCEVTPECMVYVCSDGRKFRLNYDADDIEFL